MTQAQGIKTGSSILLLALKYSAIKKLQKLRSIHTLPFWAKNPYLNHIHGDNT
jgi:hypothetical protein